MEKIKRYFRELKFETMIAALILVGAGLVFLIVPEESALLICRIIGGVFALIGVICLISYFSNGFLFGSYSLVAAITCIVFAVFCFVRPDILSGFLSMIIGVFMVVDGMVTLTDAIELARTKNMASILLFVFAVSTVTLGCLILFGNFGTIMMFVGIALLVTGVFDLIITFFFSSRIHRAERRFRKHDRRYSDNTVDSTAKEKNEE